MNRHKSTVCHLQTPAAETMPRSLGKHSHPLLQEVPVYSRDIP